MKTNDAPLPAPPKVHGRVSVETPEQIQFTFELAGAGARMMAYLIDLAIRLGVASVAAVIIIVSTGWAAPGLANGLVLVLMFALEWGYHTIIEWRWGGYTPGKWALGIRVVRRDGVAVDFVRSSMRNLLRAADLFPFAYATGLLVMFFTGTQRRLGDLAADVMVIRERKVKLRDLPPLPDQTVALPADAIDALRLDEKAMALIDEFFRRRQVFSADRGEELAQILAAPLAEKLALSSYEPIPLLAGIIQAGHERRSSIFSRRDSLPPSPALSATNAQPPAPHRVKPGDEG